ncbi:hypothetical protein [Bradyrhizobium yuanmingense]|uniref:hypothetical protein n=1 Tax=Bradyrhizobium yuanmingense TaxID=108015 RepID=UPI0023BA2ACC|nr:hypothetical protein [Bradyrhizobium yuanmingense]MDF0495369.1 hypothetical protein [Bradyrhizobium yuanmingense]
MADARLSRSELHRIAELKWRGVPPGMPAELAIEFMARLKTGSTIRKLTSGMKEFGPALVSYERFKKHCELHPEWGAEAWTVSKENGRVGKGSYLRILTHCKRGHPLADARMRITKQGWRIRRCLVCRDEARNACEPLPPEKLRQVKAMLLARRSIADITGKWLRGKKRPVICNSTYFYNARKADPEFDQFVREHTGESHARAQTLRWSIERAKKITAVRREEANDYLSIRALIPAHIADPDEIVSCIIEDILTGALQRSDVHQRVRWFVSEREKQFPTKYRKFGDSLLLSLDEALFDDGSGTRGDTVSRGLWD